MKELKIVYIFEKWQGSCGRALHDAMAGAEGLVFENIYEDEYFPKSTSLLGRIVARFLYPFRQITFDRAVLNLVKRFQPNILMVYKGNSVKPKLLRKLAALDINTVNIYPDNSPHVYGAKHRKAVGQYGLVISTKPYHAPLWKSFYGYSNKCLFVPQGYDKNLHLREMPEKSHQFDVCMVATYRREYGDLMREFAAALSDQNVSVCIGGYGWDAHKSDFPDHWVFSGSVHGVGYVDLVRSGRICIAPLNTVAMVNGVAQPGDVDTTRTYELAATHCFFIHRHSDYVRQLYTEQEVPTFHDGKDLAKQIMRFLAQPELCQQMASAAHQRAVPAYSMNSRALDIIEMIKHTIHKQNPPASPACHSQRE